MDDKYAKRIADLLRIAERGDDAEAEAALEMAERLMARYGIDRAVAMAQGSTKREDIIEMRIELRGIYTRAYVLGASAISHELNVKLLMIKRSDKDIDVMVIGFSGDCEAFRTLFTSLMLQAITSANRAYKENWVSRHGTPSEKFKFRRSHIIGFFDGARDRMRRNRREVFTETASTGAELAVRDQMTAVQQWIDDTYGELSVGRGRGIQVGMGYNTGVEAGRNAMTGEAQLKQKGQIGS